MIKRSINTTSAGSGQVGSTAPTKSTSGMTGGSNTAKGFPQAQNQQPSQPPSAPPPPVPLQTAPLPATQPVQTGQKPFQPMQSTQAPSQGLSQSPGMSSQPQQFTDAPANNAPVKNDQPAKPGPMDFGVLLEADKHRGVVENDKIPWSDPKKYESAKWLKNFLQTNPQGKKFYTDDIKKKYGGHFNAMDKYDIVNNDDIPWTDPQKYEAAKWLKNYTKTDPIGQKLYENPEIKAKADPYFKLMDGPLGQVADYGLPMLKHITGSPEQFGKFLSMPMISNIAKPFIGTLGLPGLAMAYSYLSGDSSKWKNWRTLTSGMQDPNNPIKKQWDKAKEQLGINAFMNKNAYDITGREDFIDRHLGAMRVAKRANKL
jgi:hypothetical protein